MQPMIHPQLGLMAKSLVQIVAFVLLILFGSMPAVSQTVSVSPDETIPQILDYMDLREPSAVQFDEQTGVLQGDIALGSQSEFYDTRQLAEGSWLGARLQNAGDRRGEWRLDTEFAVWEGRSEVYLVRDGKSEVILRDNWMATKISDRVPPERIITSLPIVLEPGQSADLWIKFNAQWSTHQPMRLVHPAELLASRQERAFAFGRHNGAGFALVAIMLVFSLLLRFMPAFYFSIFYAAMLVGNLILEGYVFFYLHPDLPELNIWATTLFRTAMCFAYLQFVRSFLRSFERYPRFDRTVLGLLVAVVLITIWNIFAFSILSILLMLIAIVVFVLLIFAAGVLAVKDQIRGGGFFLAGTLVFVLGSIVMVLAVTEVLDIGVRQLNDIIMYVQLLHGVVFAAAVIAQAFGLRQERDNALAAELATSEENLEIAKSLIAAKTGRDRARRLAEQSQLRLATASHDLRQPLTSLKLALEQADEGNPELKQKLEAGLEYLDGVLGGALSESRPEEHEHLSMSTEHEAVPLAIIFENIERMFRPEATAKGLEFVIIPCEADVMTDPVALIRILSNLTSNAIRYTEAGHVKISAAIQDDVVVLEVSDTGPGLSKSELEHLMKPYQRGDQGSEGEGLGLHIVSTLAVETGLTLDYDDTAKNGSTFRLGGLPLN